VWVHSSPRRIFPGFVLPLLSSCPRSFAHRRLRCGVTELPLGGSGEPSSPEVSSGVALTRPAGARLRGFARLREQKPGRQTTPRSCGLQGLTPSGCPFEPGFTGTRRYSHGVLLLQGRYSCVRLVVGISEHRFRCRCAPEDPRDVFDLRHPKTTTAPRLQGAASACPGLLLSHAGRPSWSS